ncbi:MAG TPA: signal peptide peptidase SppA [Candidatus Binataceae bacterium]|nr:signal peptide peptidase SppA [Candidatus Binataceae bacterium]
MLKRIFKWMLRTVVLTIVLFAIVAISDYVAHRVPNDSVLVVTLSGPVAERGSNGVMGLLNNQETPLNFVRRAIDRGARDPRIVGLAVKVIDPQMELAQAQEIAAEIKQFHKSGKWTAAYIETAGEGDPGNLPYMVAAATGNVTLMPRGELDLIGVGLREFFARGTLDWLGIKPNIGAIGQYKTAFNMFTNKEFTEPQKEDDEALVGDLFDQIVGQIADERHLDAATIKTLVDQAPLNATVSLKAKLVDRLAYEDEFNELIKKWGGGEHKLENYDEYTRPRLFDGYGGGDKVAVIYGSGAIERGEGGFDPLLSPDSSAMGSDPISDAFKEAREDDDVRAVVFRVDSPGGSTLASELIRRQVELTAKAKPVVVSMSGYAASGGYWVSVPARTIVADAGTITGSIGVLGGKFNIGPATEKMYVNSGAVTRGANYEMFGSFTDFTPEQQKMFEGQILGDDYAYFLQVVAANRHMTVDQVNDIAQGRVWTGKKAREIKLVDMVGTFDDAMAKAKEFAGFRAGEEARIEELPEQPGLLQSLLAGRVTAAKAIGGNPAQALLPMARMVRTILSGYSHFRGAYCPIVPVL